MNKNTPWWLVLVVVVLALTLSEQWLTYRALRDGQQSIRATLEDQLLAEIADFKKRQGVNRALLEKNQFFLEKLSERKCK